MQKAFGITGTFGAGKGTIVEYLVDHKNLVHYSARAFITQEIERQGLPVNRDSMIAVSNDLAKAFGPSHIADALYEKAVAQGGNAVIESIRRIGEVDLLRGKGAFQLWAVDADPKVRYERIVARKSATDAISYDKFREQEKIEMHNDDPNKQNIAACIAASDVLFDNNQTRDELYQKVEEALALGS